jgi:hypothetical protein
MSSFPLTFIFFRGVGQPPIRRDCGCVSHGFSAFEASSVVLLEPTGQKERNLTCSRYIPNGLASQVKCFTGSILIQLLLTIHDNYPITILKFNNYPIVYVPLIINPIIIL